MRSAQVLAVRGALLALALASVAGCFRPKINDGGFSCGDGGGCPDGLVCQKRTNTCVTTIHDGGVGGATGTGGAAGKGGTGGMAGMDAGVRDMGVDRPCLDPIANSSCQPSDAGRCDPVCNTGCDGCYLKCSVNTSGDLTCNEPVKGTPAGLLQPCAMSSFGSAQTDNCEPGLVCLNISVCQGRCYQFCRTNADCTNGATCSRDAGGGHSFCDVPPANCDPILGATKVGCSGPSLFTCYLSSSSEKTVCDCQTGTTSGNVGSDCTLSRDCFAGLVCVDFTGNGKKQCKKACRLPGDGGVDRTNRDAGEMGCVDPRNCLPFLVSNGTSSTTFGFCNEP